jgi:hypothetical protein
MATKNHKTPTASEALKAPIGAREIHDGMKNDFCAFLWPKTPGLGFGLSLRFAPFAVNFLSV